jgi:hypothetical protein
MSHFDSALGDFDVDFDDIIDNDFSDFDIGEFDETPTPKKLTRAMLEDIGDDIPAPALIKAPRASKAKALKATTAPATPVADIAEIFSASFDAVFETSIPAPIAVSGSDDELMEMFFASVARGAARTQRMHSAAVNAGQMQLFA